MGETRRKERAVIGIVWFTIIEFRPCGMSVWVSLRRFDWWIFKRD